MKTKLHLFIAFFALTVMSCSSETETKKEIKMTSYLQITLQVSEANRPAAVAVYQKYLQPFLDQVEGTVSKELLVRSEDVQVLHGFTNEENANAYLKSEIFKNDVVRELGPFLSADPIIKVYSIFN